MPIQPNGLAPYTPAATVINLIERARDRGLPSPVTKDVLGRAGVPDSLATRTLQSLQVLDLIHEDGTWTENLEMLRRSPEAEFQARLAEVVRSVYADVLQYIDPAKDDATAIRDAFRSYTPHGQQDRMVTLFIGLCERAGIVQADPRAKTAQREPRASTPKKVIATQRPSKQKSAPTGAGQTANLPAPLNGLLATLPNGTGWTQQNRDRFLKAFESMLDYCIPVVTKEEQVEEDAS